MLIVCPKPETRTLLGCMWLQFGDDPHAWYVAGIEREHVRAAVESLPQMYREVIMLREFEGFSYDEIAGVRALLYPSVTRSKKALRVPATPCSTFSTWGTGGSQRTGHAVNQMPARKRQTETRTRPPHVFAPKWRTQAGAAGSRHSQEARIMGHFACLFGPR